MATGPTYTALGRNLRPKWADLPLRTKGLTVIAIPLAALMAATASFCLVQQADRRTDGQVEDAILAADLFQNCRVHLLEAQSVAFESASATPANSLSLVNVALRHFEFNFGELQKLKNQPASVRRLRLIAELYRENKRSWVATASGNGGPKDPLSAAPLLAELQDMRAGQQRLTALCKAKVDRVRVHAIMAVTGNALLGLAGGLAAVLLFTSGVVHRIDRLRQNASRLETGQALLASVSGGDELGLLEQALESAASTLRRHEEESDRFFTLSLDLLCILDLNGGFKRANPAFTRTLGYYEADLLAGNVFDFVHPEDRAATAAQFEGLTNGIPITYFENRFRSADGSYKWLAWTSAPFLAEGLAYAVARDRTRQRSDEQAARQSMARLTCVLESITDAFFAVDCSYRLVYVNPEAERIWMRQRRELLGRSLSEIFPEAVGGPFFELYERVMQTGKPDRLEAYDAPSGRWFEVHAYPSVDGLSVYFRDITGRRQADDRIRCALREKEVLLREIHHRVKNNLQLIASMLRLQAGYVRDEALVQVLKECRERVQAMAVLHDQLHRAKDFSSINLGEYIKNLAASLFCSYGVSSAQVGLAVDAEEIVVAVDTAIPCGLIVHELLSNSLRHAFPDGSKGQVSIGLHARADDRVELTVSDDGSGFPEVQGAETKSLGLRLVGLLAGQLEALVERRSSRGTSYRFEFTRKIHKETK